MIPSAVSLLLALLGVVCINGPPVCLALSGAAAAAGHTEAAVGQQQQWHRQTQTNDNILYQRGCKDSLSTPLNPTSGSYGNIFAVRTKLGGPPVRVTSLDFYTDRTYQVTYEVWTLDGPYDSNSLIDQGVWTQIAGGKVMGQGSSRPTPIPEESFIPVDVEGNGGFRSFYITLTTPDIRYRTGAGTSDGQLTYVDSSVLSIYEGLGVILYPKPTDIVNFMKPRNFLGDIHYSSAETCAPTPVPTVRSTLKPVMPPTPMPVETYLQPVTTRVMYTFSLQYSADLQEEAVMSTVDSSVRGALDSTMRQFGTDLNWLAEYHGFNVVGVLSFPVQSQEDCMPAPGFVCIDVATTVTVSHSPAVQRPNVRHALLSLVHNIKAILPYQTTYTGNQSVQADMVVNLQGVPPRDMGREEVDLFERVVLNFVSEKLGDDYDISGAEVISQSSGGTGSGGRSLLSSSAGGLHRGRSLQSSSAESLAVTVRVTGESRNPRKRQLEEKIEDAIDNDSVAFTEELTSAAKQDPVVSAYFERVEKVSAKPVDGEDSPPGPSPGGLNSNGGGTGEGPSIGLIIGCVLGGIVAISAAVLLYVKGVVGGSKKKKQNQQNFEQQLSSFGASQRFDGYENKPPPYAGNDGTGIKPVMYGNGLVDKQAYKNTKLQTNMQVYGAPGAAAMQSKKALANHGEASMSRIQPMHGNNPKLDAKLAYNGAPLPPGGRASTRQIQSGPSRSKLDAKLAYNGASGSQSSRQMQSNRSNSRDDLERKIAMNGGAIAGSMRVGDGQPRSMRSAGDSMSSAPGGNRARRQDYHSSQGMRPSTSRGSLQSLDSAPSRGRPTSRTSQGSQSSRYSNFNESGLSSNSGNSGGFRGEEDLHFR